jgi:hypothetical protein
MELWLDQAFNEISTLYVSIVKLVLMKITRNPLTYNIQCVFDIISVVFEAISKTSYSAKI